MVMVHTTHTVDMHMTNFKQTYNEAAHTTDVLHNLSPEESSLAKAALVDIYRKLAALCHDNDLTLMLGGGSCLGAVRHKGFIPWDDDIDLLMPRKSYDALVCLLRDGKLGDDYEFACPGLDHDAPCSFLKIYKKGTRWVEMGGEYTDYPKGICLDVFPVDGAPDNALVRKAKGIVADALRIIHNCIYGVNCPQSIVQKKLLKGNTKARVMLTAARMVGKVLSIVPHKVWINMFDRFVADSRCDGMMCIPTGRKHYCGEALPANVFLPTVKAEFEGMEVDIPHDYERYLANLYGADYLNMPAMEKRERHFLVEVELGNSK